MDADQIGRARLDIGEHLFGRAAQLPIDEFQGDGADDVFGFLGIFLAPGAGVDGLKLFHVQDAAFHLAHEGVFFVDRQIASGTHLNFCVGRLDLGEKFNAVAVGGIVPLHADKHGKGGQNHLGRMAQGDFQDAHINAGKAHRFIDAAGLAGGDIAQ